jgi:hypothetical protein
MWLKETHVIVLMWKPTSHATATKVSQITSWVQVCSLP